MMVKCRPKRRIGTTLAGLAIGALMCGPCRAAPADVASIRQIVGAAVPVSAVADPQALLDRIARLQTQDLGSANPDWHAGTPQWNQVFDRVKSDLIPQSQALAASLTAAVRKQHDDDLSALASHLQQSDADMLLAYFATPQGKAYQAFIQRIDAVMRRMAGRAVGLPRSPDNAAALTPDEQKRYLRLTALSTPARMLLAKSQQDAAAHRDTSGYSAVVYMEAAAIRFNTPELRALDQQFGADVAGFEQFEGSAAAVHYFEALAISTSGGQRSSREINAVIDPFTAGYKAQWQALYRAVEEKPRP